MGNTLTESDHEDMSPKAIGRRLFLIRKAFRAEPADMAAVIGADASNWYRFEKGQRIIPLDKAARITARFGVSLDFIFLGRLAGLQFEIVERLRSAEE